MTVNIENLVFEGGGVRGIAFAGAIQCLEERGILQNIQRVAGSSAGALAATLIAIGLNATEFKNLLTNVDLNQFNDASSGCCCFSFFKNVLRFILYYSWYKGDKLDKFLGDLLEKWTGNKNITFKQVYDTYGKELIITATNVDKACTIYFHRHSYPDYPVRTAIRASMAIPLYFKPVKMNGEYLIDGGILNNYPIWIFDNCEVFPSNSATLSSTNKCVIKPNPKTLGLKLVGPDEKQDEHIYHGNLPTNLVRNYILSLIDCMQWQIERSGIAPGYWERSVIIPTFEIKTTDFSMSDEAKQRLYNSGYDSMNKFHDILISPLRIANP